MTAEQQLRRIYDALPQGARCRDCADEDGRCPCLDRPCNPTDWVIELIQSAGATPPASDAPASAAGEPSDPWELAGFLREKLRQSEGNAERAKTAAIELAIKNRDLRAAAPKVASEVAGLREALEEARRQLEYLDGRWPTGTTPAIIARIDAALTHPAPSGASGEVESIVPPENGETDPEWRAIRRAIDQFAGRVPTISKHRAVHNTHLAAIVERLDTAGDREAADTIIWQCWYRALGRERERFLLADTAENATTPSADLLEQAASSERTLSSVIAEAKRTLRLVQGCMECNADDERRWSETIDWLERLT